MIAEDETKEVDNHGSLTSLDISSPGMSGHKQGHGSSGAVRRAVLFLDVVPSRQRALAGHQLCFNSFTPT